MERDGGRSHNKGAAFDEGSQGGTGSPPGRGEQRGLTSEEVRRILRARIGMNMINNINTVLQQDKIEGEFTTLSDDDVAKADYYKFNIAVALIGVNPLKSPELSEEDKEALAFNYSWGASLVAKEYLQDDPDNNIAKRIGNEGADAPIEVHQAFFKVVNSNVRHFLQKLSPKDFT